MAPACIIAMTSAALLMPPLPLIGMRPRANLAALATFSNASSKTARPCSVPCLTPRRGSATGRPPATLRPSTPASTQHSIISATRSDDLAVSFGMRTIAGLRRAPMRARIPLSRPTSSKCSPARRTFGHIRLISIPSTYVSTAKKFAAIVSAEKPPTLAKTGTRRSPIRRRRSTQYASPRLGTPMASASELVSGYRTNRGNGFPERGSGMIEPTVRKPKPRWDNASMSSQFLSNPAASPTGLGRSTPANLVRSLGSSTCSPSSAARTRHGKPARKANCPIAWLRSGDTRNRSGRRTLR